jgi:prepilin-type N-terminal cleavage/methylation domain-containing protein
MRRTNKTKGFSLVELSIVLVILGLLTGGILSGQSLIHAAELRSITNDYNRYIAAARTFRDKYFAVPGDMHNATSFWGTSGSTGTTNGDGDGRIVTAPGGTCTGTCANESLNFWQHLANAGLIEGSYTGATTSSTFSASLGTTVPRSRIGNAGWSMIYAGSVTAAGTNDSGFGGGTGTGVPTFYVNNYDNVFLFGSNVTGGATTGAMLKAEDAWNIDTKLDDGVAITGAVSTPEGQDGSSATSCADVGASTPYYNLTTSGQNCSLVMKAGF